MQTSKIAKRVSALTALVVLVVVGAVLIGCGDDHRLTRNLVVADTVANRVLLYVTPSITTGESATIVLGQASLTTGAAAPVPPTASTMTAPVAAAIDSAGNLWVSDSGNCRVLKFPPPFTTGMAATVAVGQANLITGCGAGASATVLSAARGIAFDSAGNLWVADFTFNRVLKFPAAALAASGGTATAVLGQADFASSACNRAGAVGANTLCGPSAIAFDSAGNGWISDNINNRVAFYPLANLVTGSAGATQAVGQPGVVTAVANNPDVPHGLTGPIGIRVVSGNLYVADTGNNRVTQYTAATIPPTLAASGAVAAIALGQATTATVVAATSAVGLSGPSDVTLDSTGRAIVADTTNNRTVVYPTPLATAESATIVVGQTTLTTGAAAVTATGQNGPRGVTTTF